MKTLKVGIIGCGNIFPMHAASVMERDDAELVAVCDVKKDRADEKAEQLDTKSYYDYEEMMDTEQLDVVHICLPHYLHAPATAAATKRQIHVMTEKPMAINYDDAKAMMDGAWGYGVSLGVIFHTRCNQG